MNVRRILLVCMLGASSAFAMVPGAGGPGVDWAGLFAAAYNNPQVQEQLKDILVKMLKDPLLRDDAQKQIAELRAMYSGGILGRGLGWLDDLAGRKSFPLADDVQLGKSFTLEEWTSACFRGDVKIITHFLATDDYSHLLNQADEQGNTGLIHAAFGYLNRDEFTGQAPIEIEGFRLLAEDNRVDSKLPITVGGLAGRVPFDEWLLQTAEYKDDKKKQARLDELKKILQKVMTPERTAELDAIQEAKNDYRKRQEAFEENEKNNRHSRYTFLASIALTVGCLYYYFNYYKKGTNTTPQTGIAS